MIDSASRTYFNALFALLSFALLTAQDCPFGDSGSDEPPVVDAGVSAFVVDFGGTGGSGWQVNYDNEFTVSLRTGTQLETVSTTLASGPLLIGGMVFDLGHFCFRNDVVCPQRVLTTPMRIRQPDPDQLSRLDVDITTQGPLVNIPGQRVSGQMISGEAQIPLAVGNATVGICALITTSQLILVADTAPIVDGGVNSSDADSAGDNRTPIRQPTSLAGRITVAYTGNCATIGGSGNVSIQTQVEITATFTATR